MAEISKAPMSLDDVLTLVQGSISALPPEEQEKARRLIANQTTLDSNPSTSDRNLSEESEYNNSKSISKVKKLKKEITNGQGMQILPLPSPSCIEAGNSNVQPRKPLSAYNVFFQLERKRIIESCENADDAAELDFTKRDPYTAEDLFAFGVNQQKELASCEPKPKRKHRKTHGKIGFADLARTIASNWKAMSVEERSIFQDYFEGEQTRYRNDLLQLMSTEAQMNPLSDINSKSLTKLSSSEVEGQHEQERERERECEQVARIADNRNLPRVRTGLPKNDEDAIGCRGNAVLTTTEPLAQLEYQSMRSALSEEKSKQLAQLRTMKQQIAEERKRLQEKNESIQRQMLWMERQREVEMMRQLQTQNLPPLALIKNNPAFLAGLKYAQLHGAQISNPVFPIARQQHCAQSFHPENADEQQLLDFDMNTINHDDYTNDDVGDQSSLVHDMADRSLQNIYQSVNPSDAFGAENASLTDIQLNSPINNEVMMKMMMMNQGANMQRFNPMMANLSGINSQHGNLQPQSSMMQSSQQRQRIHQAAAMQRPGPGVSIDNQRIMMMLRQRQMMAATTMDLNNNKANADMHLQMLANASTNDDCSLLDYQSTTGVGLGQSIISYDCPPAEENNP